MQPETIEQEENMVYLSCPNPDDDLLEEVHNPANTKDDFLTVKIDPEVLTWFRQRGKGFRKLINVILNDYVANELKQKAAKTNT